MSKKEETNSGEKRKLTAKCATSLIILGMAGSGKTTFVQRLLVEQENRNLKMFCMNLDPAVGGGTPPDRPSNDHNEEDDEEEEEWTEVMEQYGLGPNGAIMTCLNLYTTRFHEVLEIFERRKLVSDYIVVDTPGQIEVFTWSASGSIITEAIAGAMPTVLVFIIDTPRTKSPSTFASNMLYACSVMFRTKLPMIIVFNKTDIEPCDFAKEWMTDVEAFQQAIDDENDSGDYMSSLTRSMGLVLCEFYSTIETIVGVSSATGEGMDEFFRTVDQAVAEYETTYLPEIEARKAQTQKTNGETWSTNSTFR